jgi:tungstate transport system ATP-binding protein
VSAPRRLAGAHLSKAFEGRPVLDDISMDVHAGELHVVLGPSGSGKSTLVRLLNMLTAPDKGDVLFGGDVVTKLPRARSLTDAQRRARLRTAVVLQKPVAFRGTAVENAAFGLRTRGVPRAEAHDRGRAALDRLGIGDLADKPARRLSGGEIQRLAFARATVLDLDFLLLDEFTANLDPPNVLALEGAAREFAHERGGGVLLVTHDLLQARRLADRVSLLADRSIVESGPREDFFERPADDRTRRFISGEAPL